MNSNSEQLTAAGEQAARGGSPPSIWLGYEPTGGRVSLRLDDLNQRLLVAGQRSDDLSALIAYACQESGLRMLILDTNGTVSEEVSGYMEHYDYNCLLYDAFQVEEEESTRHGQLIAAAYAAALGLDSEEEAIVNAGLQKLAIQDNRASPDVLFDAMDSVEGFRGFYVDKIKGRVGALKFLESAENESLRSLLPLSGSIVSFATAIYPQVREVVPAVFLAKLLAILPRANVRPDIIMLTGAQRVFGGLPRVKHRERLLAEVLDSRMTFVLATGQMHALSQSVVESFPNKILSSDAWNNRVENRWREHFHDPILPNASVIVDGHYGHQRTFIARSFEARFQRAKTSPKATEGSRGRDSELMRVILEDIRRYETPTRTSIIEFLSAEFGIGAVESELDALFAEGCVKLETRESKPGGHAMLVYVITPRGLRVLEGMRR